MKKEQEEVDAWIKNVGKRYFNELTNLGQLIEEVGELSRLIIRQHGEQSWKSGEEPVNIKEQIGEELSDILFVTLCLANQMHIDLDSSFEKKMAIKTNRDYQRHQNNTKL
ncbi:MAG: nucleotide pyrophosphohydrolase [Saprospiraceae bacterium]|nr:nucleotide pyrophosphohydrolase [Saprospiraceae bacterium]